MTRVSTGALLLNTTYASTTYELKCGPQSTIVELPSGTITFLNKTMSEREMPEVQFNHFVSLNQANCPYQGVVQVNYTNDIEVQSYFPGNTSLFNMALTNRLKQEVEQQHNVIVAGVAEGGATTQVVFTMNVTSYCYFDVISINPVMPDE